MLFFVVKKMQREISDKIQLAEMLNPLNSVSVVSSVDNTVNVKDLFGKVDKPSELCKKRMADASLITYIPGASEISR